MTHLKDNLLASIKAGKIDMKPKWHFVLKSLFYVSGLLLSVLLGMYFFSFILFMLRESGLWWTPGFGFAGLVFFVIMSPWLLIAITLVFLVTVYLLARHFGHNYRHRATYTLIGVVLLVIGGASLIEYLAVHNRIRELTDSRHIPGLSPLYRESKYKHPSGITPGRITAMTDNILQISNREGTYIVLIEDAKRPVTYTPTIGEHIMVFGTLIGTSTIKAKGIRPLPPPMERQLEGLNRR